MIETYPIDKKIIKCFNDINQDIKKIFKEYYFFHNGIITGLKEDLLTKRGTHYVKTNIDNMSFSLLINMLNNNIDGYVIKLDSDKVYRVIKDFKSKIEKIVIDDDFIIYFELSDSTRQEIGKKSLYPVSILEKINIDLFNKNEFISVGEKNFAELLIKNDFFNINVKGEYIRITKDLFPGLKKTDTLLFNVQDFNDDLFISHILIKRSATYILHQYYCIKM